VLRVRLNRRYDKSFPAFEDGLGNVRSSSNDDDLPTSDKLPGRMGESSGANPPPARDRASSVSPGNVDDSPQAAAGRSGFRVWTDRSGQHQIQAKFLGVEEGKVKLEKSGGKVVLVTMDSLSEADQRFIGAVR
jgi:hypothetical protein